MINTLLTLTGMMQYNSRILVYYVFSSKINFEGISGAPYGGTEAKFIEFVGKIAK